MKKLLTLLLLLLFCTGCDRMLRDMMHDDPEQKASCGTTSQSSDAKTIFQANCASCHNPMKDATGPALYGTLSRWKHDTVKLKQFIKNSGNFIRTGNPYAVHLYKTWDNAEMTAFPNLTDKEFELLLEYMK